jgi:hypothetical protein
MASFLQDDVLGLDHGRVTLGRSFTDRHSLHRDENSSEEASVTLSKNYYAPLLEASAGHVRKSLLFGTLNLDGLSPLFTSVMAETKVRPGILGVVETYRTDSHGRFILKGYTFLETRMVPGSRRGIKVPEDSHGVGFFVRNEWLAAVESLENPPKFKDCMWIRVNKGTSLNMPIDGGNLKHHIPCIVDRELWVGIYYLSPVLSEGALKDVVRELASTLERAKVKGAECVVMGDLNCCLRTVDDPLRPGTSSVSHREQLIGELLESAGLRSLHVLQPVDPMYTVIRGGTGRTMRDYIIVSGDSLEKWSCPKVRHEDWDSDHWMVTARRTKILRRGIPLDSASEGAAVAATAPPALHPGWKTRDLLKSPKRLSDGAIQPPVRGQLEGAIRQSLVEAGVVGRPSGEAQDVIVPRDYESWKATISSVLDATLGVNGLRRKRKTPSFINHEVWERLVARRRAYKTMRKGVRKGATEEEIAALWNVFLACKKESREAVGKSRRSQWLDLMGEINSAPSGSSEQWKLLERTLGVPPQSWGAVRDGEGNLIQPREAGFLPRWREFYQTLGNGGEGVSLPTRSVEVNRDMSSPLFFKDPPGDTGHLNVPLTLDEVRQALLKLPDHKARGADGFSNEALKALGPEALLGVLSWVWQSETCPNDWQLAIIHPLPKPGDRSDLGNTRGISLLSCLGKLFEAILNTRLATMLENSGKLLHEQGGFRATRECPEHAVVLHESLRRRRDAGLTTYVGFIDFAKAFDRVWRDGLLWKLKALGVEGKMLRMVASLYRSTEGCVRVNDQCTASFPIVRGVRQGGVLSPLLFVAFINDILDQMRREGLGVRVPQIERDTPWSPPCKLDGLLWADDIVLLAESPEGLQRMFTLVDQWCEEWGMGVNAKKSNVLAVGPDQGKMRAELAVWTELHPFKLGGDVVDVVRVYKYLGVQLQDDLKWDLAATARTTATRSAIFAKSQILRNTNIAVDIRRRYMEATVIPVALWGSELWAGDRKVCARVDKCLAPAYRMILQVPTSVARTALAWELGLSPTHLRVAAKRTRLYLKWRGVDPTPDKSNQWPRRLMQAAAKSSSHHWSWFRRTELMATWLGITKPHLAILQGGKPAVDFLSKLNTSSLGFYRAWASTGKSDNRKLAQELHKDDTSLDLAQYLRYSVKNRSVRVLTLLRTGGLMLNDRVHKIAPERPSTCLACDMNVVENLEHFLLECPRYVTYRNTWASAWGVAADVLFARRPNNSVWAALGESPHAEDDGADLVQTRDLARLDCVGEMWRKRCALVAVHSRRQLQQRFTSGVEAQ